MNEEQDDRDFSPEDELAISALAPADKEAIDQRILSFCDTRWRKVAFVVASAMNAHKYIGVPDVYYAMRVRALVADGLIEAEGNLRRMRFCEVRLPQER